MVKPPANMSIKAKLLLLIVSILVPAVAAGAFALRYLHGVELAKASETLLQLAHGIADSVERDIAVREGLLKTLAVSPALLQGDIRTFYHHAQAAAPTFERTIVLSSLTGQQMLNTRLPLGAKLPHRTALDELRKELKLSNEATLISNLYFAPIGKQFSFAVQVPVLRDGRVEHYLSMGSFTTTLQQIMNDQRLRAGWNAAVLDRHGTVVARRLRPVEFVGKPATQDMRDNLARAPSGVFSTVRLDGVQVYTGYVPIGSTGWTMVVSMPQAELLAQARSVLNVMVLFGIFLLLLVLGVAWFVARSIHLSVTSELQARVREAVAESKRAQEALLQHQRLEALGRLTGGIAHDFNNILQTLNVSLEVASRLAVVEGVRSAVETGRRAVQRGTQLTRQLLSFGASTASARTTVNVAEHIGGQTDLVRGALRENIAVQLALSPGLWPVTVDVVQLDLALLNIALNARDAMPRGGVLRIAGENVRLAEREVSDLPAGEYVRLAIADTGEGIDEQTLPRIFDPFFTTKEPGKGSGLGLAQVYGFMSQCGGAVAASSRRGEGTTLSLYFPRASGSAVSAAPAPEAPAPQPAVRGVPLLFVDDDPLIRRIMVPALEAEGFVVHAAENAGEAWEILNSREIAAVLSDIVMPGGRSGVELAREARQKFPHLRIVLATGYADDSARDASFEVLSKPYNAGQAAAAIRDALRR